MASEFAAGDAIRDLAHSPRLLAFAAPMHSCYLCSTIACGWVSTRTSI